MIPLISIKEIVDEHYTAVRKNSNLFWIIVLFFLIPFIFSAICIFFNKLLSTTIATAFITTFAIFTGFLLNIILLLFSITGKYEKNDLSIKEKIRKDLLSELFDHSVYLLVVSSIILILLVIMMIFSSFQDSIGNRFFSFIIYFGFAHFCVTLLMVFRRLFALLHESADGNNKL